MARQSPNRHEADEPEADSRTPGTDAAAPEPDRELWATARVEPVEIALPAGVGFTLRAYRLSTTLTPTEISDRDDDDPFEARRRAAEADDENEDDDENVVILDEEFAALLEDEDKDKGSDRGSGAGAKSEADDADEPEEAEFHDESDEPAEDVPVFLSHRGKLLLFKSPESLVTFVRSGAPHDLAQLDTWTDLADRVEPKDVVPAEDDTYELDLVVENLRGGHDSWDLDLLIQAGEIARDLAYALRLRPVLTALSTGTPLDDLDEALRSAAGGGVGGFMGRRKLRRIGAQQASLGWRSIIANISAAVDWRD